MSRTAIRIALVLPLLLLLTSCVRLHTDFVVHSQDSIDITFDYGVNAAMMETAGQEITGDQMCSSFGAAIPQGVIVPYEDDTYVGCRLTGTAPLGTVDPNGQNLTLGDGVWTFTMAGSDFDDLGESTDLTGDMFSDFRVSVTFPGEVLTHNGSSTVDGNKVTWTNADDLLNPEGLVASGKDAGAPASIRNALFAGLAIALALLAGLVVLVLRARRNNAAQAAGTAYPGQQYPGQPYPGQPYPQQPGQPYPGQQYPGQPYPPQPGQPYPGQPYPPQPGQPYPGQPYPPQADAGQAYPQQPYQGQGYPGQPYPDEPYPTQPADGRITGNPGTDGPPSDPATPSGQS